MSITIPFARLHEVASDLIEIANRSRMANRIPDALISINDFALAQWGIIVRSPDVETRAHAYNLAKIAEAKNRLLVLGIELGDDNEVRGAQ